MLGEKLELALLRKSMSGTAGPCSLELLSWATEQSRPDRQALRPTLDSTLSDRGSHGERAPTRLIWRQARAAGMAVRAARERTFCRTREPADVLEVLAWSPAVQKAAGLLRRSCRNRRETGPGRGREPSARCPFKE